MNECLPKKKENRRTKSLQISDYYASSVFLLSKTIPKSYGNQTEKIPSSMRKATSTRTQLPVTPPPTHPAFLRVVIQRPLPFLVIFLVGSFSVDPSPRRFLRWSRRRLRVSCRRPRSGADGTRPSVDALAQASPPSPRPRQASFLVAPQSPWVAAGYAAWSTQSYCPPSPRPRQASFLVAPQSRWVTTGHAALSRRKCWRSRPEADRGAPEENPGVLPRRGNSPPGAVGGRGAFLSSRPPPAPPPAPAERPKKRLAATGALLPPRSSCGARISQPGARKTRRGRARKNYRPSIERSSATEDPRGLSVATPRSDCLNLTGTTAWFGTVAQEAET